MTNLKDYLTDMVKETIVRHNDFKNEMPNATKEQMADFVEDIVDEYIINIKSRLIGE
jgi:hypothetical protein